MRRSKFGHHFIKAQTRPTTKCRLTQTLAISVEKSVAHQLCRSNCTLADTAVRFVSKIQDSFLALVNQFKTSRNVRYPLADGAFKHQNIACAARDIEYFAKKPERRIMLHRLQLIATGRRTIREIVARQKHWPCCGADPFSFKAANVVRFSIRALLANPSLNRTLCGGPRLAIISFLAKPGPPQSAG